MSASDWLGVPLQDLLKQCQMKGIIREWYDLQEFIKRMDTFNCAKVEFRLLWFLDSCECLHKHAFRYLHIQPISLSFPQHIQMPYFEGDFWPMMTTQFLDEMNVRIFTHY